MKPNQADSLSPPFRGRKAPLLPAPGIAALAPMVRLSRSRQSAGQLPRGSSSLTCSGHGRGRGERCYNAGMATITIPNVPQDVHAIYVARAKKAGMSLEAYMRLWLADLAARARIEEIVEEAGRRRAQEQSGREDEG